MNDCGIKRVFYLATTTALSNSFFLIGKTVKIAGERDK